MSYKHFWTQLNCKLVLMAHVVGIIVLADVMPKVCGRWYCNWSMLILWQMESHSGRCCNYLHWVTGRCYCHSGRWSITLVDGSCFCHCGRWNSHIGWNDFDYGRCYCLCGRWNGHWVNCLSYFILSSEMLNRTASHMWGRWYLHIFLFRMDCWPLCILIPL